MTPCWCEIVNGRRHHADGCPKHEPEREELERLIEEQRKDDVPFVRHERGGLLSLDAVHADGVTLGNLVGVDLDGRLVCNLRPPRGTVLVDARKIPHGTIGGYTNHRCRCTACKAANAARTRAYVARNGRKSRARAKAA